MSDCTEFCASEDCTGCAEKNTLGYSALVKRLRATKSRSKRALLDTAAEAIEELARECDILELQNHLERCEHEHTQKELDAALADRVPLYNRCAALTKLTTCVWCDMREDCSNRRTIYNNVQRRTNE